MENKGTVRFSIKFSPRVRLLTLEEPSLRLLHHAANRPSLPEKSTSFLEWQIKLSISLYLGKLHLMSFIRGNIRVRIGATIVTDSSGIRISPTVRSVKARSLPRVRGPTERVTLTIANVARKLAAQKCTQSPESQASTLPAPG